jgi:DNA or RNA helicases of superfamily II
LTQRKRAKKAENEKPETELDDFSDEEVKKELANFPLFSTQKWGLMIYDEVHLLPAPVFRLSTEMQATRRLGLTATLVREDHKETEVFSLIGPKKYDIPWRILEAQGWIATADCNEIRIPMEAELKMKYALAPVREKITLASTNPEKTDIVERLLKHFDKPDDRVLIIGQYIDQLESLSKELDIPLITGKTPNKDRESCTQPSATEPQEPHGLEGRQLRHRPARRERAHPDFGYVRQPPGRSPAPRPRAAPQE